METIKIFAVAKKKKVRFTGYCSLLNIPGGSDSNKSACNTGDLGSFPGLGNRSSGEGNGNPLNILAWKVPCMEEPAGLQSMGSQRVRHN